MAYMTYEAFFEGNLYKKTFTEWEYVSGISSQVLRRRAKSPNTTPYNFLKPVNGGEKMINAYGEIQSCREWSKKTSIPERAILDRLKLGWAPERAVSEPLRGRKTSNKRTGIKPYIKYTYKGKEYTIEELAEIAGLPERVMRERLQKRHWDVEKAVRAPQRRSSSPETRKKRSEEVSRIIAKKIYIEIEGEKKTVKEWSVISGVPEKTIYSRLKSGRDRGWDEKQIVFTLPHRRKHGVSDKQRQL